MEQKIIVGLISAFGTVCLGLITNYISDKLKSHSISSKKKSDFEFNFKFNNLEFKIKSKKH